MATIQQNIERIEQAKLDIKQAIVDKGVAVLDTDRIDTYASKIEEIKVGEEINNQNIVVTITENKPTTVIHNDGYTGLGEVNIRPTVVYDVSATYDCPWKPDEFIERYKNGDWKRTEGNGWAEGYIYKPEDGVIFSGTDYWQRGYYQDGNWYNSYNVDYDLWKEPMIDNFGIEKMANEKIRPVKLNSEWNNYESFDFFKGKPLDNDNIEIRDLSYSDFYDNSKTIYAVYEDGWGNNNKYFDEYDNGVYFENPFDMTTSDTPLMVVAKGGYGAGLEPNENHYYGMILPKRIYKFSMGKFGPTFTPMGNYRYHNVSDFVIIEDDNGNYYDAADITYEMITYEHPLASNIKSMNRILVYNDYFHTFKNLQYINYLELHNNCTLPETLKGVGVIVLNGFSPKGLFKNCKYLKEVPWFNTSNVKDFSEMFKGCESLTSIPDLDMDSATNLNSTFQLTGITTVPKINTRNVTNMGYVLGGCTGITEIPDWDFSNTEIMQYAFYNTSIETADINLPKATELMSTFAYCRKLKSVNFTAPELKGMQLTFNGSTNLESIGPIDASNFTYLVNMFNSNMTKLVNFGGMQNLKIDWNDNNGLKRCPNLTYESLMNVINGLYDFVGNGEVGGKTLLLSTASQSKLSDADIEIATNKGWTITFA